MKRRSKWAVAIVVSLVGCATLKAPLESRSEKRFEEGLAALGRGDYRVAYEHLAWVAEHNSHEIHGQRALLTLAAMELDPRNPVRRLAVGADLAGGFLRLPEKEPWTQPVAQTLYLLGLELGATEERAERAERQAERAAATTQLPNLPGPSITAKLRTVEQERERLARRVDALEKQLLEKQQELDRIKKTIRP